jgi:hypothetical protein
VKYSLNKELSDLVVNISVHHEIGPRFDADVGMEQKNPDSLPSDG